MSKNQELHYPSLKAVIQYLEPNLRLELTRRCPSLFHVEKAVPLCLDYLYLGPSIVRINNTKYSIVVYRQYPPDVKPLKHFKKMNEEQYCRDLDKYGCPDLASYRTILPGDVRHTDKEYRERTREEDDDEIERLQQRLSHLNSLRRMKEREEEKDRIRATLFSNRLKRSDTLPPYTMYLKFTQKKAGEKIKTEYLDYNKKQFEACKYLFTRFFRGRKHPIAVKELHISSIGPVLRLPFMKIRARSLIFGTNVEFTMNALQNILVDSSQIKGIDIYHGSTIIDSFQHPVVKSAIRLDIRNIRFTGGRFHIVLNDEHRDLFIYDGKLTVDEYMLLIMKMINDERPVGTTYCFGVHNRRIVKELLSQVENLENMNKRKLEGCIRFPFCYSIPISSYSQLVVYCNRTEEQSEPWNLYICVESL